MIDIKALILAIIVSFPQGLIAQNDSISNTKPDSLLTVKDNQLKEANRKLVALEEKLKRDSTSTSTFSLDPKRKFYGFSLGADFDLLEGLSDNNLYADLYFNIGEVARLSLTMKSKNKQLYGSEAGITKNSAINSSNIKKRVYEKNVYGAFVLKRGNLYSESEEQSHNFITLGTLNDSLNYKYSWSGDVKTETRMVSINTILHFDVRNFNGEKVDLYGTFKAEYRRSNIISTYRGRISDIDTLSSVNSHDAPLSIVRDVRDTFSLSGFRNDLLLYGGATIFRGSEGVDLLFTATVGWRVQSRFRGYLAGDMTLEVLKKNPWELN